MKLGGLNRFSGRIVALLFRAPAASRDGLMLCGFVCAALFALWRPERPRATRRGPKSAPLFGRLMLAAIFDLGAERRAASGKWAPRRVYKNHFRLSSRLEPSRVELSRAEWVGQDKQGAHFISEPLPVRAGHHLQTPSFYRFSPASGPRSRRAGLASHFSVGFRLGETSLAPSTFTYSQSPSPGRHPSPSN